MMVVGPETIQGAAVRVIAVVLLATGLAAAVPAGTAAAQELPPGTPDTAEPPLAELPPAEPAISGAGLGGIVDVLGRMVKNSASKLDAQLKDARERFGDLQGRADASAKDAVGAARDAAGAIMAIPSARIISGHELCPVAPNGAPDCRSAADAMCRGQGQGLQSGRSLDTATVQKCPARAYMPGRFPSPDECPAETFVTRVVCQ
jgi:hypothetical protein